MPVNPHPSERVCHNVSMLDERKLDSQGMLDVLRARDGYAGQIVHVESMPHSSAAYQPLRAPLNRLLKHALDMRGIDRFYTHQAEAIDALRDGQNVVVATGTASGKSLCYNVPVLNACLESSSASRGATALYIFPVKALAHDQLRALEELTAPLPARPPAYTYDGDTPHHERAGIRKSAQLLLTNPEMLHIGILPNHRGWSRFLRRLRYVVIDEGHMYRGVFGSHVALLIRRLRRICRSYGANPQFVVTSATLGNAREHAEGLTGLPMTAITDDGAPSAGREFALWNPPIIDDVQSARRSVLSEGAELFSWLVARGTRTLSFVRTRQAAELMYRISEDQLQRYGASDARVSSYRAGYVPEERREIEARLSSGDLTGVVTTNALELGIDIGHLDATLLNGYPGSLAATFQQAGRSGRRGARGLSVMLLQDNPLEQYLARHPDIIFRRGMEHARISTTNPRILEPHLICAAYEAPLGQIPGDIDLFGGESVLGAATERLVGDSYLIRRNNEGRTRWHAHPKAGNHPAGDVQLRSASGENYMLVEEKTGRVLETIGEEHAFANAHEGAVYLHRGDQFLISELNLQTKVATLQTANVDYYTDSMADTDMTVLETEQTKQQGPAKASVGPVDVTRTVYAFNRRRHDRPELLSRGYLDLPPRDFTTVALWWTVPTEMIGALRTGFEQNYFGTHDREDKKAIAEESEQEDKFIAGTLHAAEHACISLLPLFALCDRNDIGGISTPYHASTKEATIFIYDGIPGGVGIAERGYDILRDLWQATLDMLKECPCEEGCPSCVQSPKCGNNNEPLDKRGAGLLLGMLVEDPPAAGEG